MARAQGKRYPSDQRRWFRLVSSDLATQTAHLSDAEFRAFVLILARANENRAQDHGEWVHIARSELLSVSPNGRQSVAKSTRTVRELVSKQTWEMREDDAKVSIKVRNWSQIQGFAPTKPQRSTNETPATTPTPTPTPTPKEREREVATQPAKPGASRSPRRVLIEKPETFGPESKERIRAWADRKGYDRSILNAGLDLFRDWEPQKPPYRRTAEQWEGAFKTITREAVAEGKIGSPTGAASKRTSSKSADDVLAEAARRAAEDDARYREHRPELDDPEHIGDLIDLSLAQAARGGSD